MTPQGQNTTAASMSGESTSMTPKKKRSRLACQRCHNRRVRCDASVKGPPCSHCAASNLAGSCRLIESRKVRGERGRFSSRVVDRQSPSSTSVDYPHDTAIQDLPEPLRLQADDHLENTSDTIHVQSNASGSAVSSEPGHSRPRYSRPPRNGTPSEADQWTKIVTRDATSTPERGRITYLGESWNLSYFLQWKSHAGAVGSGTSHANGRGIIAANLDNTSPSSQSEGHSPSLHIPVPPSHGHSHGHDIMTAPRVRPSTRTSRTSPAAEAQLPLPVQRELLDAYCRHHLTLYPIMSETRLRSSFDANTISSLLLAAVLYAGAIHAPEAIIYRAGFDSRQACLRKLYLRAKSLFFDEDDENDEQDSNSNDSESDPLARVQAAFLLHHMWFRPNSTMDCWTWLSLAVRLAQNMGMHRSTARSSLRDEDRKLWKRIWWSLYVSRCVMVNSEGYSRGEILY